MSFLRKLFLGTGGHLREGWKAALFLALHGLLQEIGRTLLSGVPWASGWLARQGISLGITLLVSSLLLQAEGRTLADLGLRFGRRWGLQALAGAALGFLLMVGAALTIRALGGFHWEQGAGLPALGSGAWLFLVVACREELLFRGYAFQRLVDGLGAGSALAVGALFFAYAHWDNPGMGGAVRGWATLNIGLAGVLLGLCWLRTRSLAMPMGLHLAWNWTQGSLLGFGVSGLRTDSCLTPVLHDRPDWLTGGAFGIEASLPCAALCALAIGGLVLWRPGPRTGAP